MRGKQERAGSRSNEDVDVVVQVKDSVPYRMYGCRKSKEGKGAANNDYC